MAANRPKVTVLNAYAVHPVDNGGGNRIHWLYRTLAAHANVDLVTLGLRARGSGVEHPAPGLRELRVARTEAHERADQALQQEAHAPVHDIAALENVALTPDYLTVLENSLAGAKLAILAHPYMAAALKRVGYAGNFIHESQNCERALKRSMLPSNPANDRLVEMVEEAEAFSVRGARLVYACCEADAQGLLREYGGRAADTIVIPNGTDTRSIRYVEAADRRRVRRHLRMTDRPLALFLGSGHRPNIEAAEVLIDAAKRMPGIDFVFVGNLHHAFAGRELPANVAFAGFVSDAERNVWLEVADVALNPMLYGGGTNLKLLDYFAAGIPVVSTEIGVRGTGAVHGRHVLVADVAPANIVAPAKAGAQPFDDAIREAVAGGPAIEAMTREARALVEREFDWHLLGERLYAAIVERGLL